MKYFIITGAFYDKRGLFINDFHHIDRCDIYPDLDKLRENLLNWAIFGGRIKRGSNIAINFIGEVTKAQADCNLPF